MSRPTTFHRACRANGAFAATRLPRRRGHLNLMLLLKATLAAGVVGLMLFRLLPDAAVAAKALAQKPATCRVVTVIDGDTVGIWCPSKGIERARLKGFDTPEIFSPKCASELSRGRLAKKALRRVVLDAQSVRIVKEGRDRYGRSLIRVWADGKPVSRIMISGGYARAYGGGRRSGWCG